MTENQPNTAPDGPSERLGGGGEGQGVLNADAEALSQVLTEVAFAQIATEQMLTILPIGPNRAQVPAHWRDEAEMRAQPYIEEALAVLPSSEADRLREALRALVDEPQEDDLRLDAYYYGFAPTGVTAIDCILSAVAHAGKAYHHTESWNDDWAGRGQYLPHGGETGIDAIQNAANAAAGRLRALLVGHGGQAQPEQAGEEGPTPVDLSTDQGHADAWADTGEGYTVGWRLRCLWCDYEVHGATKREVLDKYLDGHQRPILERLRTTHAGEPQPVADTQPEGGERS